MGGFLAVSVWLAGGEAPSPELVFGLTVANTLFMGVAEQLLPRRRETDLLRDPQTLRDLAHGMTLAFLARPAAATLSLTAVAWGAPRLEVQTRTAPSRVPVASRLPSPLKRIAVISAVCSIALPKGSPSADQSLAVLSTEPEPIRSPAGLQTAQLAGALCLRV